MNIWARIITRWASGRAKAARASYGYKFKEPRPRHCQACVELYGADAVYAAEKE